jgi:hypothetical protein
MNITTLAHRVYPDLMDVWGRVAPILYAHADGKTHNLECLARKLTAATKEFHIRWDTVPDTWDDRDRRKYPERHFEMMLPWIAAETDWPKTAEGVPPIVMHLAHPRNRKRFAGDGEWILYRVFRLFYILGHELIHRYQMWDRWKPGDDDKRESRVFHSHDDSEGAKYWGEFDEIEAHAHDTVWEMWYHWGVPLDRNAMSRAARKYFRTGKYPPNRIAGTIQDYRETFGTDPSHPALRAYIRKIRSWTDALNSTTALSPLWKTYAGTMRPLGMPVSWQDSSCPDVSLPSAPTV